MPAQIVRQIRTMIAKGALSPGVHLGQSELAAEFSASRVPVREALKLLAAEGIVVHDPNRGFFVAKLSSDEARQLYRVRQLLESEVLRTVEWPSAERLAVLKHEVEASEEFRAAGDLSEWARHHRAFREAVFSLSPERFIVREALRLWSLADRYRSLLVATQHPSLRPKGDSTDRHLLTALEKQDRARLLRVFEEDRGQIAETLTHILAARGL